MINQESAEIGGMSAIIQNPARRGSAKGERSQLIRDTGAYVMESVTKGPRKTSRKKKKQPPIDYSGAYFKHTNFERAVIATNGRAPYNNKEVELITKPEGFDPNSKAFKNNWVNNLMKSGIKSPRNNTSAFSAARIDHTLHTPGPPSASVTATTVFQGFNGNDSYIESQMKPPRTRGAPNN